MESNRFIYIILGLIFIIPSLNAQLTNITFAEWYDLSAYRYTNEVSIITDFYKFTITPPPHQTINVRVGATGYLFQNIHNVGNLNEAVGISLVIVPVTNSGITIGTYSNMSTNTPISITPPIDSGETAEYYIGVSVSTGYKSGDFYVIITNRGSTNSGGGITHPAYFIVVTNRVHIIQQQVEIVKASDGIHTLEYDEFYGNNKIGNLGITFWVSVKGDKPESVVLFYDMNGIPDGSPPYDSVEGNRKLELEWNGEYWIGKIPATDPEIEPGNVCYIIIGVKVAGETNYQLYGIGGKALTTTPTESDTWRFNIAEYVTQQPEAEYTISVNNKFDPTMENYSLIYRLTRRSHVNVSIYNVRGELVRQLKNEVEDIGKYVVEWDGKNENGEYVATGLYLVIIQSSEFGEIRKVIVIKR